MTDCPLDVCDGTGWIEVTDFTGGEAERCPCGQWRADERTEAQARREKQQAVHDYLNGVVR